MVISSEVWFYIILYIVICHNFYWFKGTFHHIATIFTIFHIDPNIFDRNTFGPALVGAK